jgi:hypothetical protein
LLLKAYTGLNLGKLKLTKVYTIILLSLSVVMGVAPRGLTCRAAPYVAEEIETAPKIHGHSTCPAAPASAVFKC